MWPGNSPRPPPAAALSLRKKRPLHQPAKTRVQRPENDPERVKAIITPGPLHRQGLEEIILYTKAITLLDRLYCAVWCVFTRCSDYRYRNTNPVHARLMALQRKEATA